MTVRRSALIQTLQHGDTQQRIAERRDIARTVSGDRVGLFDRALERLEEEFRDALRPNARSAGAYCSSQTTLASCSTKVCT
jgi:hypothetical protein